MLVLVGSGEYLPGIELVDRFLIGQLKEAPRVVCLPTAAGLEGKERIAYWSDLGVAHFMRLGVQDVRAVPVVDRISANNPEMAYTIWEANFAYLSGGKPDYLYQTLHDTRTWEALLSVHERGGILAGCSAGAMVMGTRIPGFPRWGPGFNLLQGTLVIPHFDEISKGMVKMARFFSARDLALVGIERNTALFVNAEKKGVIGTGAVEVWVGRERRRYINDQSVSSW
jgi:cyanophycinase